MNTTSIKNKKHSDHNIELTIKNNIYKFADNDGLVRENARKQLVDIGPPAIDFLSAMETHPKSIARWEAVKALAEIRNLVAAPLLINALEDRNGDVRWLAAEGLAALGKEGLKAVLEALIVYPDTVALRKGAHHVLTRLAETSKEPMIKEFLEILNDPDAALKIPLCVRQYLKIISKNNDKNES